MSAFGGKADINGRQSDKTPKDPEAVIYTTWIPSPAAGSFEIGF
jgi:hypothetical protein